MPKSFAAPRVVIRPALPKDKADVFEFTKFTWEGADYIQYVWDDWFSDPHGYLFTAEFAGRAIGMGKLSRLNPGEWWLQGLRVDPRYQDTRVGSRLNDFLTQQWVENGDGVVRFLTSDARVKVHRLAERSGFVRIAEIRKYLAPTVQTESTDSLFEPVAGQDIPLAARMASRAETLPLHKGLVDMGWKYARPSENVFHTVSGWHDGWVLWWRGSRGVLICWENQSTEIGLHLVIGLAACSLQDLPVMLRDVQAWAGQSGYPQVGWYAFSEEAIVSILVQGNFSDVARHTNYLYEKEHPRLGQHRVYIALGTNLGNRKQHLMDALAALPPEVQITNRSSTYETPPWGYEEQPAFLNMVVEAQTALQPQALLDYLKSLELELGRVESFRYGPRQIDLDILFYDDLIIDTPPLVIPHPRLHERAFVLVPLEEIAAEMVHPLFKETVSALKTQISDDGIQIIMNNP